MNLFNKNKISPEVLIYEYNNKYNNIISSTDMGIFKSWFKILLQINKEKENENIILSSSNSVNSNKSINSKNNKSSKSGKSNKSTTSVNTINTSNTSNSNSNNNNTNTTTS